MIKSLSKMLLTDESIYKLTSSSNSFKLLTSISKYFRYLFDKATKQHKIPYQKQN